MLLPCLRTRPGIGSPAAAVVLASALALGPPSAAEDLLTLYTRALESDPVLQSARIQVQVAEAGLRETRFGGRPQLSAALQSAESIQNIRGSDNPLFVEGRSDFSTSDFNLSLTQPIYRPEYGHSVRSARTGVQRVGIELEATRQELMFRLARAMFDVLAARDDVELALAERRAIGRQLAESEERLTAGLGTPTTVHEARARLALAQAAEIDARDGFDAARDVLTEIIGSPVVSIPVLAETYPLVPPDPSEPGPWVESALFRNPRLRALQTELDTLDADLARRRAVARRPALDFVGSYNENDTGATEFGGGRRVGNTNLTLRLSVPLWDGGRAAASYDGASLQRRQAIERVELTRRQLEREVRDALRGTVGGAARVAALGQSVFSQEAVLSQRGEALRAGLTTRIELLDATRELFAARRDLARARYLAILNDLRLRQAAGILSEDDLRRIDTHLQREDAAGSEGR